MNFVVVSLHGPELEKPYEVCATSTSTFYHKFYRNLEAEGHVELGQNTIYTIYMTSLDSSFQSSSCNLLRQNIGLGFKDKAKEEEFVVKYKFPECITHNLPKYGNHKFVPITDFPMLYKEFRIKEILLVHIRYQAKNKTACDECVKHKIPSQHCAYVLVAELKKFYDQQFGLCDNCCHFLKKLHR